MLGKMYNRVASSVFSGVFEPALFRLDLMRKDIGLALELGREFEVPVPLASFSEQLATQAVNQGWGARDVFVTILLQEEAAGVDLRSAESRVPGSGVRGRGSGERETTASSLAGKQQAREKEDNGGQGKDGPAGAIAQGGNGR